MFSRKFITIQFAKMDFRQYLFNNKHWLQRGLHEILRRAVSMTDPWGVLSSHGSPIQLDCIDFPQTKK